MPSTRISGHRDDPAAHSSREKRSEKRSDNRSEKGSERWSDKHVGKADDVIRINVPGYISRYGKNAATDSAEHSLYTRFVNLSITAHDTIPKRLATDSRTYAHISEQRDACDARVQKHREKIASLGNLDDAQRELVRKKHALEQEENRTKDSIGYTHLKEDIESYKDERHDLKREIKHQKHELDRIERRYNRGDFRSKDDYRKQKHAAKESQKKAGEDLAKVEQALAELEQKKEGLRSQLAPYDGKFDEINAQLKTAKVPHDIEVTIRDLLTDIDTEEKKRQSLQGQLTAIDDMAVPLGEDGLLLPQQYAQSAKRLRTLLDEVKAELANLEQQVLDAIDPHDVSSGDEAQPPPSSGAADEKNDGKRAGKTRESRQSATSTKKRTAKDDDAQLVRTTRDSKPKSRSRGLFSWFRSDSSIKVQSRRQTSASLKKSSMSQRRAITSANTSRKQEAAPPPPPPPPMSVPQTEPVTSEERPSAPDVHQMPPSPQNPAAAKTATALNSQYIPHPTVEDDEDDDASSSSSVPRATNVAPPPQKAGRNVDVTQGASASAAAGPTPAPTPVPAATPAAASNATAKPATAATATTNTAPAAPPVTLKQEPSKPTPTPLQAPPSATPTSAARTATKETTSTTAASTATGARVNQPNAAAPVSVPVTEVKHHPEPKTHISTAPAPAPAPQNTATVKSAETTSAKPSVKTETPTAVQPTTVLKQSTAAPAPKKPVSPSESTPPTPKQPPVTPIAPTTTKKTTVKEEKVTSGPDKKEPEVPPKKIQPVLSTPVTQASGKAIDNAASKDATGPKKSDTTPAHESASASNYPTVRGLKETIVTKEKEDKKEEEATTTTTEAPAIKTTTPPPAPAPTPVKEAATTFASRYPNISGVKERVGNAPLTTPPAKPAAPPPAPAPTPVKEAATTSASSYPNISGVKERVGNAPQTAPSTSQNSTSYATRNQPPKPSDATLPRRSTYAGTTTSDKQPAGRADHAANAPRTEDSALEMEIYRRQFSSLPRRFQHGMASHNVLQTHHIDISGKTRATLLYVVIAPHLSEDVELKIEGYRTLRIPPNQEEYVIVLTSPPGEAQRQEAERLRAKKEAEDRLREQASNARRAEERAPREHVREPDSAHYYGYNQWDEEEIEVPRPQFSSRRRGFEYRRDFDNRPGHDGPVPPRTHSRRNPVPPAFDPSFERSFDTPGGPDFEFSSRFYQRFEPRSEPHFPSGFGTGRASFQEGPSFDSYAGGFPPPPPPPNFNFGGMGGFRTMPSQRGFSYEMPSGSGRMPRASTWDVPPSGSAYPPPPRAGTFPQGPAAPQTEESVEIAAEPVPFLKNGKPAPKIYMIGADWENAPPSQRAVHNMQKPKPTVGHANAVIAQLEEGLNAKQLKVLADELSLYLNWSNLHLKQTATVEKAFRDYVDAQMAQDKKNNPKEFAGLTKEQEAVKREALYTQTVDTRGGALLNIYLEKKYQHIFFSSLIDVDTKLHLSRLGHLLRNKYRN